MRFGYRQMLGIKSSFKPLNRENLDALALSMTDSFGFFEHRKFDLESLSFTESLPLNTPSGYVYLGQFIAHDISFDSMSDRHNTSHQPWNNIDLDKIYNKRNAMFDLETIYGYETISNLNEVPRSMLMKPGSNTILRLGDTFPEFNEETTARLSFQNDLPRDDKTSIAQIVDPRNDDNVIIAQTQVAFIKFHNAIVKNLGKDDTPQTFEEAKKIAIRHYQYIILEDFLPRIVNADVLKEIRQKIEQGTNEYYHPNLADMYIPLEFSGAAFRFGHSLIRNDYNYNLKHSSGASLSDIFNFTGRGKGINDVTKNKLRSTWIINWKWFYDFSKSGEAIDPKLNFAEKLDTKLSSGLNLLIPKVVGNRVNSLSALDLYRGVALQLPSGQEVADKMKVKKLTSDEIESTFGDKLQPAQRQIFKEETPLFYYLLAEAKIHSNGNTLGEVGSRIVAEVILKLIKESTYSILNNEIQNDEHFLGTDGKFGMTEMLEFINQNRESNYDEINPIQ